MSDIGQGLLVTELIGSSIDMVTGDYSRGASGFWIENGELTYPVSEITIAGNLRDIFRNVTPGKRPRIHPRDQCPVLPGGRTDDCRTSDALSQDARLLGDAVRDGGALAMTLPAAGHSQMDQARRLAGDRGRSRGQ